jgi:hypothetical protein
VLDSPVTQPGGGLSSGCHYEASGGGGTVRRLNSAREGEAPVALWAGHDIPCRGEVLRDIHEPLGVHELLRVVVTLRLAAAPTTG